MQFDKDLSSIQEARNLAAEAKKAQEEFKHFNQDQVDKIIKAMAEAGYKASEVLAKMAVDESGFGKAEDKTLKNQFATRNVYESICNVRTVGIIAEESDGKILKIAVPMGVVAALIPSTNPTSTLMFKTLISLKGRNAIVASPHPRTTNCTLEAAKILSEAAENAGAPKGLIQCMTSPTIEGTKELMQSKDIAIILATGSNEMVKSAYSSGKPAYGVGAGNVPAFIERTADYKKAVADVIYGTTFDNGTLCSSEQAIIADEPIKDKIIEQAKLQGCYFLSAEEKEKLSKSIHQNFRINPDIVGQSARFIARYAGFDVPEETKVLVASCYEVGKKEPLSMEKLSPILAFYVVDGWLEGCHRCIDLLNFGGLGHTLVIHSNDPAIIMKFALEKPAFRILVNTVASVGAVGLTTALNPSMTLGPGTWGGSIISENVTARHLINVKSLAFETNPVNKGDVVTGFEIPKFKSDKSSNLMKEIEERLRARAGNLPLKDNYVIHKESLATDKYQEPHKAEIYGKGISEEEIQKIMKDFRS
ncbi:MAG: aldehyde dehydrogenase family protein [Ignavibacteriaceae bacterium]|nr:aldehyde dehydrogenase family protein [Ignavibacteriaceae bacterium]